MAPLEPKLDSKEFEIPDPAQPLSSHIDAGSATADITIRVWNPERPVAAGSITWKTDSVFVFMIADLVAASQGQVDESASSMTARFDGTGRALVAARRIQTAILEFVECRSGDELAAAILVHPPPATPGGFSAGMALGALRLAEPGQILLAEEAARRVHDIPGIELRTVPALTTGGDGLAGLVELVWTTPGQIARLKASLGSGQHRDLAPSMGATMIVNSSFGGAATREIPQTGGAQQSHATVRSPVSNDRATSLDAPDQYASDQQQPFLTRTRLILGGAAIVLAAVLVWWLYPSQATKPTLRPTENQLGGAESPSTPTPQPIQPQTPKQPPLSEPAKPPVAVTKQVVQPKPPAEKHGKDKTQAVVSPPAPQEPQPVQSFEGMTQKDIPSLLQMAKKDAGSGSYDMARREYHIILQLQPSNAEAREGLRRLDVAQSER